jgi:hypothetical protein
VPPLGLCVGSSPGRTHGNVNTRLKAIANHVKDKQFQPNSKANVDYACMAQELCTDDVSEGKKKDIVSEANDIRQLEGNVNLVWDPQVIHKGLEGNTT